MTKKLTLVLSIVIAAAFLLGACAPAAPAKPKVKVCEVTDMGGIDDRSFNALGWAGVQQAIKDLGVDGQYIESKQQSDYAPNLAACKDSGADLIISVGFLLADDTNKAATANPTQKYAIVDSGSAKETPNLLGNGAQIDQNTFLAGYLSAGMTKTGTIGTYVGILFPATQAFMDGYYLGMTYYNTVHGTNVKLLGFDPAKPKECLQTGNFNSTDDGRKMAQTLMDEGADIIMPVAGPVGWGSAAYMKEKGQGLLIGVDQDWSKSSPDYPDYILASAMKRIDVFVYNTIKAVQDGTFKGGSDYILTLANNGIALAYGSNWVDKIPAALKAETDALIPKIIAGEIKTAPAAAK